MAFFVFHDFRYRMPVILPPVDIVDMDVCRFSKYIIVAFAKDTQAAAFQLHLLHHGHEQPPVIVELEVFQKIFIGMCKQMCIITASERAGRKQPVVFYD